LGRRRDHRQRLVAGRVDPVAPDEELVSVQFLLLLRAQTSRGTVAPFNGGSRSAVPRSGHGGAASPQNLNQGTSPPITVPSRPTGSDPEVRSASVSPSGSTRAANRSPRVP